MVQIVLKNRLTDTENKHGRQRGSGGGWLRRGMNTHPLPGMKRMTNQKSTENWAQYLLMIYKGKDFEKEYIYEKRKYIAYIYTSESLRCTPETNPTL